MESLYSLLILPNLLLGIWSITQISSGILDIFNQTEEHHKAWRFFTIEALTNLVSPIVGFSIIGNPESGQTSNEINLPMLSSPTYYLLIGVYTLSVLAYWFIKMKPELLVQTNFYYSFSILVVVLFLITILGALAIIFYNEEAFIIMFFPGFGFPVMAIFINLLLYPYRLLWCNKIYRNRSAHSISIH